VLAGKQKIKEMLEKLLKNFAENKITWLN